METNWAENFREDSNNSWFKIKIGIARKFFLLWLVENICLPRIQNIMTICITNSIKAIGCQWVSLSVCLFPNSFETTKPDELKFRGMIPLGMQMVVCYKASGFVKPLAGKQNINQSFYSAPSLDHLTLSISFISFVYHTTFLP